MNRIEKIAGKMIAVAPFSVELTHADAMGIQMTVRHAVISGNDMAPVSKFQQASKSLFSYVTDMAAKVAKELPLDPDTLSMSAADIEKYDDSVGVSAVVGIEWGEDVQYGDRGTGELTPSSRRVKMVFQKLGYV